MFLCSSKLLFQILHHLRHLHLLTPIITRSVLPDLLFDPDCSRFDLCRCEDGDVWDLFAVRDVELSAIFRIFFVHVFGLL